MNHGSPSQRRWALTSSVFLGLVTHRGTRFPGSSGIDGLVTSLAAALKAAGIDTVISIHADDFHSEDILPLTASEVRRSIRAELALEKRWRTYVNPDQHRLALSTVMGLRRTYRTWLLAPPWDRSGVASTKGAAMLRRLVNIELAHMGLLRQARDSGADWILIVEDDAQLANPDAFARSLAELVQHNSGRQPRYVNISRSFSHERLHLEDHLTPVAMWDDSTQVLSSDIPLTNTVCAILYRRDFLNDLLPALERIPISPVLPIDWKLNQALLDLVQTGALGPADCWFLDPAPVVQGSMHVSHAAGSAG